MISKEQHLLVCINEECAEVQKAVDKILRFNHVPGTHQNTNYIKLRHEINDLIAVIEMFYNQDIIDIKNIEEVESKKAKVSYYLTYAGLQEGQNVK